MNCMLLRNTGKLVPLCYQLGSINTARSDINSSETSF